MRARFFGFVSFFCGGLSVAGSLACADVARLNEDVGPASDAPRSPIDAGTGADSPGADAPLAPLATENRGAGDFTGCLDGIDADDDLVLDCAEESECGAAPVCCIGSTRAACCAAATPATVTLSSCSGSTCGTTPAALFGAPDLAAGLRGTNGTADGGVVLGTPLDPRLGTIELRATIVPATMAGPLDWVAFGLTPAPGGSARMLPAIAVQVNAALDRSALLVGETIVATTAPALVGEVTLRVDGSGAVTAGTASAPSALQTTVVVRSALHPTAYGRASGPDGLSITSLTVGHDVCDIPAALDVVAIDLVDEALAFVHGTEANPSLVRGPGDVLYLAFDAVRVDAPERRGIFLAEQTAPSRFVVRNPSAGVPQPILGDVDEADEVTDPDLSFDGSRWELFVAGEENGSRSILHVRSVGAEPRFGTDVAALALTVEEFTSFDAPARVPGAPERLLVRATSGEESSILQIDLSALDSAFASGARADGICSVDEDCTVDRGSTYVVASRPGTGLFDADEVDDPSLVVGADRVHRLYYAGRRANRWTLSVVVSEDGDYWRRISSTAMAEDALLGSDDELAPLGVRSVGTLLDDDGTLTLALEGWYGTRSRFLIARQTL